MAVTESPARSNGRILATVVGLVAAGVGANAARRALSRRAQRKAIGGHAVSDLQALGEPRDASARAPEAFRPDPTAPVSEADRAALAPATGPVPSIAQPRGAVAAQP
ncbi:hypothetical protein [Sphingomonas baiyangensis]|uniref:Uncharacterized protein n=1 Tax=Sphingomonas baiyangensis TaxID=2572576 RepID=A0A4U1L503_9SPHN|nr:hypothetical protein [Sphingomonas baiyangensis]TKD52017.1 hypothetical protein FBR43_15675 [Sphingomonas baiyangensis]